ncbi:lytic transglycosylase domain-containing protein [Candidatus Gracilibacteria bacterium]|nr:lytic transglycosylase domain-containing protein [Candidatus Gracilibacteria bacterium]
MSINSPSSNEMREAIQPPDRQEERVQPKVHPEQINSDAWQRKIDSVLETFRNAQENPELNEQDKADVERMVQTIPAGEFLRPSPEELQLIFLSEDVIDFHHNENARRSIGMGDLFVRDQEFLRIGGVVGKRSVSFTGKVGYLDRSGDYIAVYGGEKIETQVSEEEQQGFEKVQTFSEEEERAAKESFRQNVEVIEKEESELVLSGAESLKGQALLNNPDFSNKLNDVCGRLGIDRSWLEKVMWKESSVNTKALNKIGAVGLIQFLPRTASSLGTSTGALRMMSGVDQLDYVEKYFSPYKGNLYSVEDLYIATFYPGALGKSDNFVLGSEKGDDYARRIAEQNKGMSHGSSYLTRADIERFINS